MPTTNGLKLVSRVADAAKLLIRRISTKNLSLVAIVGTLGVGFPTTTDVRPETQPPNYDLLVKRVTDKAMELECLPVDGANYKNSVVLIFDCEDELTIVMFRPLDSGDWIGRTALFPDFEKEQEF